MACPYAAIFVTFTLHRFLFRVLFIWYAQLLLWDFRYTVPFGNFRSNNYEIMKFCGETETMGPMNATSRRLQWFHSSKQRSKCKFIWNKHENHRRTFMASLPTSMVWMNGIRGHSYSLIALPSFHSLMCFTTLGSVLLNYKRGGPYHNHVPACVDNEQIFSVMRLLFCMS